MQQLLVRTLLHGWNAQADFAGRLVADLDPAQMTHQPTPGANHPAWVLSHLHAYLGPLAELLDGRTPEDPIGHRFGMKSVPLADASAYLPKDQLVETYLAEHQRVADLLAAAPADTLTRPTPVERWQPRFPAVAELLGYVMLHHESYHLGQLSAWRRLQNLPPA
ncbi:MAG: DinB family protein [Planctomycetota bacterium]